LVQEEVMMMGSAAAKKAWATMRRKGIKPKKTVSHPTSSKSSAAAKARATMRKGRRIKIHSASVNVGSSQKGTYAPPKGWWDHMTKDPHGSAGKPLSAATAGHLWFKVYDNSKRLQILKEYG
jgi:hypothetical protein